MSPSQCKCKNSKPRFNASRPCSTSLLRSLFIAVFSTLPIALPSPQSTFTRTKGHCLGAFVLENFSLFYLVKCNVSHHSPSTFSSLGPFGFKGLTTYGTALGVPYTPTMSDLLCLAILALIIRDSSTKGLWQ
jgi:hypothetical protein